MGTRHGSLEETIATARALKPLASSSPDPDCNWPIRAALLRLIPVLCFRRPHPRAGDQGGTLGQPWQRGAPYYCRDAYYQEISWAFNLILPPLISSVMVVSTHLVLLTVHTSLVTCSTSHLGKGMDWPGLFEESRNEIISFGFILQGSWGVKATRNNGLDSSLAYFWGGLFMLETESFTTDVNVYKLPSSILPILVPAEDYTPRSSPPPLGQPDPSHRFMSPSNRGLSKPGHIS
ncbi:uncharacterized protein BO96DRAFT_339370 [Aspergillus niger CBS 101883]|uniref:Contig An18c0100, genomic contig n=2 Tax=Aspergillus niger TaxID=5061 RepID=A2RAJ9_ASPNC|nr:uncharacterized protein BO96DRAFT_339370 [Aspergillus niger CBS 101883]XP_059605662.1 uncharacterized protein An18g03400 [Aspergillus niger]PYH56004.1 hypothetical protein BO96DRAFT_339370 [Aspergillus niger CBS 101883]CAK48725.1 unnamed protein product [Aspergillus niger]